jgi:hypothetical protein
MKKKGKAKKPLRILILSLVIAALAVFSVHVFVDTFENELFDIIANRVEKSSGGMYSITCDYADFNFFKSSVYIKNLSISTREPRTPHTTPGKIIRSTLPDLRLEGISILPLLLSKSLYVDNVSVKDGQLTIFNESNETRTEQPVLDIPNMSAQFSKLKIVPGRKSFPKTLVRFRSGEAALRDPVFHFPDGFYSLKAKTLDFSKPRSSISIDSFELIPRYKPYEFSRKKGYRSSRLSLKIDKLLFKGIDFNDLFMDRAFHSASLTLREPALDIFRNRNIPKHPRPKAKKFPQQLLREAKLKLRIDNINISNGTVNYTERPKGGIGTGKLFFNDIRANVKNVTNYPELLKKKTSLLMTASAKIMGAGLFKTDIELPMEDNEKINPFTFSGSLDRMNIKAFNPILEHSANIRINKGTLNKLYFSIWADKNKAAGEMRIFYKNLKISMLKKGSAGKKRKVVSFLANTIIHKKNPRKGKPLRIGRIYFKRQVKKSFFSYLWKSLLSGIKSSIGLKKRKR